jgi:hypothetical protein
MNITINHTVNGEQRAANVLRVVYLPQESKLRVAAGFGPQDFDLADEHPLAVALAAFVAEQLPA